MTSTFLRWPDPQLSLVLEVPAEGPVRISHLGPGTGDSPDPVERAQPLVEVLLLGEGHTLSNTRFSHSAVGARLRHVDDEITAADGWTVLRVRQADPESGLETVSVFRAAAGVAAVQTWTEVRNTGTQSRVLQMVSSFAADAVLEAGDDVGELSLMRARSEWCAEGRWSTTALHGRDGLADIHPALHGHASRGSLVTTGHSTWSSGMYLPTGVLTNGRTGKSWAWQVEHNGAWHWEVDSGRDDSTALSLIVTGPNDGDHQWSVRLAPGESFCTVPVSVAVSDQGYEAALGALTAQRRAIRRPHAVDSSVPVIFNDYMNTLMGDPTTERLLPLIDAAAASGAEYFCIDAGWYDDGGHWWDSVGEWQPSTGRFPDGGLDRVLDHIRSAGMQPGLWLEPEVVGVRSPVALTLPDEAFLQRYGQRVVEHSRYLLDLRHPAAREHLDAVVDRLVGEHGVRYFKLDYNVTPGPGTDRDALSAGAGLLEHNRAHLAWLDAVLDRHPDVIFENCASGAMRQDYAMMSRLQLQSTSDQQDFRLYPVITAAAPASLLPEQAGNWAYPQPGMSDEEIAFAMLNGMVGRLYLSGHLDQMSAHELDLVKDGVRVYQGIRAQLAEAVPFWPLGLPGWFDDVVAVGLRCRSVAYLAVWSRGVAPGPVTLPLPGLPSESAPPSTVYPSALQSWEPTWDPTDGVLVVTPPREGPTARLFEIRLSPDPSPTG